jgi:hypothetical protein
MSAMLTANMHAMAMQRFPASYSVNVLHPAQPPEYQVPYNQSNRINPGAEADGVWLYGVALPTELVANDLVPVSLFTVRMAPPTLRRTLSGLQVKISIPADWQSSWEGHELYPHQILPLEHVEVRKKGKCSGN